MLFRDVIDLGTVTHTPNDMGDTLRTISWREVMADKQSIRQSEFYQAAAVGLKPELMFVASSVEYQGEAWLRYQGTTYTIIRTYSRDDERTELICSGLVNKGATP